MEISAVIYTLSLDWQLSTAVQENERYGVQTQGFNVIFGRSCQVLHLLAHCIVVGLEQTCLWIYGHICATFMFSSRPFEALKTLAK